MANNASDVLIETIMRWGVDTIFGLPGDGINGIMEALRVRQDKIRFVQVRHEEAAAFMACAYAKYTGKLGCCLATSGPGGIHLLNGLYDAKMDQAPVLAITGQTYSDLIGSHFQQEVNMRLLFEDVACYNEEVINPNGIHMIANEACRHALNIRGVAHITVPIDYQVAEVSDKHSQHNIPGHTNAVWQAPYEVASPQLLEQAAAVINQCSKPVILVGRGAINARNEVIALAERIGAPIVKALLGKEVVPDDHPYTTGGIGLLGTTPSQEAMEQCDCLIIIGSSFPYMEFLPKPGQARGIQIDDKPDRLGLRFPIEVGLAGDAQKTTAALLELITQKDDNSWIQKHQNGMQDWWQLLEKRATNTEKRGNGNGKGNGHGNGHGPGFVKPQRVAWELSKLADDNAIISGDSGTNTTWIARYFKIRGSQKFSCSGNLATMAPGLPYAIAAKIAFPERQSIAFVGDGAFTMLMGEFATAVKHKLPIIVVLIKNNVLGQIKWEQIVFLGNPEYGVELQEIDFAKYAEACGGVGIKVTSEEQLVPALEEAMRAGKPALVEVSVDPNEPPMPPKVELEQAMKFAEALVRGQPNRGQIALTLFRDKLNELI